MTYLGSRDPIRQFALVHLNFLQYCRKFKWDHQHKAAKLRRFDRAKASGKAIAVGVHFHFEMKDNFLGQIAAMFFPHQSLEAFNGSGSLLRYTNYYVGVLNYLKSLRWRSAAGVESVQRAEARTPPFPVSLSLFSLSLSGSLSVFLSLSLSFVFILTKMYAELLNPKVPTLQNFGLKKFVENF